MPRLARVVAPNYPHHVIQRGNRRQQTFFNDEDYEVYKNLMAEHCAMHGVKIWAYCLMPNHVHLIAVPKTKEGLNRAIGEAHRRYTRRINFREKWRGYLWQGRFASYPMDESYTLAATRYIELNPVRAKLVKRPEAWPWSSAKAHLTGKEDGLVKVGKLIHLVNDWKAFLQSGMDESDRLRQHEHTGRPLGNMAFIERLEKKLDRILKPQKPGRKKLKKEK